MINQTGREFWIALRLDEWQAVGITMKEMREQMDISIREMAKELGVSIARLKRFEKGDPVQDSKLLYNAYILKICGDNYKRHFENLRNYTQGIQQYQPTLETQVEYDWSK